MGEVPVADFVIAADSGANLASSAGIGIDLVVGDLDSIDPDLLERLRALGTEIEDHPRDKDATDLELAIAAGVARQATSITVAGGGGQRLDHLLANAAVLASPRLRAIPLTWMVEQETVYPVHDHRVIATSERATVSVLAVGAEALGVTLSGLRWPLTAATLAPDSSLGMSNVALGNTITVAVETGVLMVIVNNTQN
jgi:thiamine pyrophosphokinase